MKYCLTKAAEAATRAVAMELPCIVLHTHTYVTKHTGLQPVASQVPRLRPMAFNVADVHGRVAVLHEMMSGLST